MHLGTNSVSFGFIIRRLKDLSVNSNNIHRIYRIISRASYFVMMAALEEVHRLLLILFIVSQTHQVHTVLFFHPSHQALRMSTKISSRLQGNCKPVLKKWCKVLSLDGLWKTFCMYSVTYKCK